MYYLSSPPTRGQGECTMRNNQDQRRKRTKRQWRERRGIIVVLTAFLLTVLFAFLALSVDTGRVVLTETRDAKRGRRGFARRFAGNQRRRVRSRPRPRLRQHRREFDRRDVRPERWPHKWPRRTASTSIRPKTLSSASECYDSSDWPLDHSVGLVAVQRRSGDGPPQRRATRCRGR